MKVDEYDLEKLMMLPSDSFHRQDSFHIKKKEFKEAEAEKTKMEELQRHDKKLRTKSEQIRKKEKK